MCEKNLINMAAPSTEHKSAKKANFDAAINKFINVKAGA
jgi:hypothetical protein